MFPECAFALRVRIGWKRRRKVQVENAFARWLANGTQPLPHEVFPQQQKQGRGRLDPATGLRRKLLIFTEPKDTLE